MLRQKSVDEFNQPACADGTIIVLEELHRGIQQFCRLDSHQIPVFLFEKLNSRMRQWFQRGAKPVFHAAGAIGNASKLSVVAAEKCDDAISLSERIRLQYNRVALMERHIEISTNPQNSTTDVVGLGLNAMDTICVVPRFPSPNAKIHMRDVRVEPGGQVATALVACTRLGLKARYIGCVGTDDWGKAQSASLRAEGLEVHLREVEGASSQIAIILLEEGVRERTILWRRDPRLSYPVEQLRRETIVNSRILHLDGCDSAAALQAARWAREAGIPVIIDIDEVYDDSTHELLRLVDYLIASSDFAEDPRELADRYGCPVVGITRGAEGALFLDRGRLMKSSAFRVSVLDTTGAGDVFHGAFIYGLLQNWPLEDMIRFSHAVAAMKCMCIGARRGIPTLSEVREFLKTAG
jgi:sulfofructose kinase